ncbi:sensor histidine kinase [Streptomyces sp. NPDC060198]|uniref:sensor histidine kinase n=1 Tax=Streptomyces sp. NPDC060198 TaxID=3347070 RepID=UPI00365840A8
MTGTIWTSWPSREALTPTPRAPARSTLSLLVWTLAAAGLLWATLNDDRRGSAGLPVALAVMGCCVLVARWYHRFTLEQRLWPSLALLLLLTGLALAAYGAGATALASALWCGGTVLAVARLPLGAAVPMAAIALASFAALVGGGWMTTLLTTAGLCLGGHVVRLDAEARGGALRLLAQERAARAAETERAALDERSRIAREIHDVLAHSLSAQMVHLEAARLLIEREPVGAFRDQVLERVVSARSMAREGLTETRQALSALRGETTPVEDFLRNLVSTGPVELSVEGPRRSLAAGASQAVRRVAQEAVTNVRKHAPGAHVRIRLEYLPDTVVLEVRDTGGGASDEELMTGGPGYGLTGMRERAEVLGGALEAGPGEEGFVVTLRLPT